MNKIPTPSTEIAINFDIDGKTYWWPAIVESLHRTTSKAVIKEPKATVIYQKHGPYQQQKGMVRFINSHEVHILNKSGRSCGISSWKFHETQSEADSCSDAVKNTSQISVSSADQQLHHSGHTNSEDLQTKIAQMKDDIQSTLQRVSTMEYRLDNNIACQHRDVWNGRVLATKVLLKSKLMDYKRRSLKTLSERQSLYCGKALKPHISRLSVDCDYDLFKEILNSHKELQATDGRYHFKLLPDHFKVRIPTSYQSKVVLLFPFFSSMLQWMGIHDNDDIKAFHIKYTSTPRATILSLLGGLQWNDTDRSHPINFFLGRSCQAISNSANTNLQSTREADKEYCLYLENGNWDSSIMNFSHNWRLHSGLHSVDAVTNQELFDGVNSNMFSIVWEPSNRLSKGVWSPETHNNRNIILGTLSIMLPSVHFYGSTAVEISNLVTNNIDKLFHIN